MPLAIQCFKALTRFNQIAEIWKLLVEVYNKQNLTTTPNIVALAINQTKTIPAGSVAWSVLVTAATVTVNGTTVANGQTVRGIGPLAADITVVSNGTGTGVITYETLA